MTMRLAEIACLRMANPPKGAPSRLWNRCSGDAIANEVGSLPFAADRIVDEADCGSGLFQLS
jgi:hypothetical protein